MPNDTSKKKSHKKTDTSSLERCNAKLRADIDNQTKKIAELRHENNALTQKNTQLAFENRELRAQNRAQAEQTSDLLSQAEKREGTVDTLLDQTMTQEREHAKALELAQKTIADLRKALREKTTEFNAIHTCHTLLQEKNKHTEAKNFALSKKHNEWTEELACFFCAVKELKIPEVTKMFRAKKFEEATGVDAQLKCLMTTLAQRGDKAGTDSGTLKPRPKQSPRQKPPKSAAGLTSAAGFSTTSAGTASMFTDRTESRHSFAQQPEPEPAPQETPANSTCALSAFLR